MLIKARSVLLSIFSIASFFYAYAQVSYDQDSLHYNRIDSIISDLEDSVANERLVNSPVEYSNNVRNLMENYLICSMYDKAELFLKKNLDNPLIIRNSSYKAGMYILVANLYRYKQNYPTALKYYLESNRILTEQQNWPLLLFCKIEQAEFYRKVGKFEKARELITEAFSIHSTKKINDRFLELKLYNRAAAIENESRPPESSIPLSQKALSIARELNNAYYTATSLNELGFSYKQIKKLDTAIQCFYEAENIFWNIGAYREAIHTMNNRAMLYAHNGFPKQKTIELYEKIIALVEERKIDYPLEEVFKYIYLEYDAIGDTKKAYYYFRKYHNAFIMAQANKLNTKIQQITEQYQNEKIQIELDKTNIQLNETSIDLKKRQQENTRIYIVLIVFVLLIVFIVLLLVKLNSTNQKLKKRNLEKDSFIQEIHHRVKNNLQFVSSLINMQMKASSESAEIISLNDASRRIRAMALVHEMLYKQEDSIGISIKQYMEELISSLNDIINSDSTMIKFDSNIINKNFSVTSSIALGMITSELISNSIKYAFKNTEHPEIKIILQELPSHDGYNLIVRDNGIGVERKENDPQKLGMRLIDIFSRQLKGEYKFYNDHGCVYQLNFKTN